MIQDYRKKFVAPIVMFRQFVKDEEKYGNLMIPIYVPIQKMLEVKRFFNELVAVMKLVKRSDSNLWRIIRSDYPRISSIVEGKLKYVNSNSEFELTSVKK